jgi:hypothetical protein
MQPHSIDPHRRMVTTSFSHNLGDPSIESLANISYTQTHSYNAPDMATDVFDWSEAKSLLFGKPSLVGEFGLGDPAFTGREDPQGLYLHNGTRPVLLSAWSSAPLSRVALACENNADVGGRSVGCNRFDSSRFADDLVVGQLQYVLSFSLPSHTTTTRCLNHAAS